MVSESIIANHTCASLVGGEKMWFCTNHEIHENITPLRKYYPSNVFFVIVNE